MDLSNDFRTWELILQESIDAEGSFLTNINTFIRLLELEVCGQFPDNLKEYKSAFFNSTVPNIVRSILDLSIVDDFVLDETLQVISKIQSIFLELIRTEQYPCKTLFLEAFSQENHLYEPAPPVGKSEDLKRMIVMFSQSKELRDFINDCQSNQPTQDKVEVVLHLASDVLPNCASVHLISSMKDSVKCYLEHFFASFDIRTLRSADQNALRSIIKYITKLYPCEEANENIWNTITVFSIFCFQSPYLVKVQLGADLVIYLTPQMSEHFLKEFNQIIKSKKVVDYILFGELHESVINIVAPHFNNIIKSKIGPNLLEKFWIKIRNEENLGLMTILCKAFYFYSDDEINQILDRWLEYGSINLIKVASSVLSVEHPNVSLKCAEAFVKNVAESKDIKKLLSNTNEMFSNQTVRNALLCHIREYIEKGQISKPLLVLGMAITKDSRVDPNFVNGTIKAIKDHIYHRPDLFVLLSNILKKGGYTINLEQSDIIWRALDPYGYLPMVEVIRNVGIDFLDFEAIDNFTQKFYSTDFRWASREFVALLFEFLKSYLMFKKKLTLEGNSYKLLDAPEEVKDLELPMVKLMFHVIAWSADKPAIFAIDCMIKFFLSIDMPNKHLAGLLIKITDTFMEDEDNTDTGKARILALMRSIIVRKEETSPLAAFGIYRHHEKRTKDFYIINAVYNGRKIPIWVNQKTPLVKIQEFVAITLGVPKGSITLYKERIKLMNQTMSALHVVKDTVLKVTCDAPLGSMNYPIEDIMTHNFNIDHFQLKMISIIDEDSECSNELKNEGWRLLKLLPTSPLVVDKVREDPVLMMRSNTDLMLKYILQDILTELTFNSGFKELFMKEGADLLVEFLLNGNINSRHLITTFAILKITMPESLKVKIDGVLNTCTKMLNEPHLIDPVSELLIKLTEMNPDATGRYFVNNVQRILNILMKGPIVSAIKIKSLLSKSGRKGEIFNALSSEFSKYDSLMPRMGGIMGVIASVFCEDCDAEKALAFCQEKINDKNPKYVDSVCTLISSVFKVKPELVCKNIDLIDSIIPRFLRACSQQFAERPLKVLEGVSESNEFARQHIIKALRGYFVDCTPYYNYDATRYAKSFERMTGLKNLGATCYLNSILQQLYSNNDIYNALIETTSEVPWVRALHNIYMNMKLSSHKSVNTRPFVESFNISDGCKLMPTVQMDASEFFGSLIDQLSSQHINKDFIGETLTTIKGVNVGYSKEIRQPFSVLSIPVKGFTRFEDALYSTIDMGRTDGYFAEELNQKITVAKRIRVSKAPKYLVIQLNRFEYNVQTYIRTKVNDFFQFPKTLDLSLIMHENNSETKYNLKGIVLHTGNTDSGHYFSFINIKEKWVEFNDENIKEVTEDAFPVAYGGGDLQPSAYLLFYDKIDEKVPLRVIPHSDEIAEENKNFERAQASFCPSMLQLLMGLNDIPLLMEYYINVILHGKPGDLFFGDHVIKAIDDQEGGADIAIDILNDNVEKIIDTLLSEAISQIRFAFAGFIVSIVQRSSPDAALGLLSTLIEALPDSALLKWTQSPALAKVITGIFNATPEHKEMFIECDIVDVIAINIAHFFEKVPINKMIDVQCIIEEVSEHCDYISPETASELMKLYNIIIATIPDPSVFFELVIQMHLKEKIDLDTYVKNMINTEERNSLKLAQYASSMLGACSSSEQVNMITTMFTSKLANSDMWLSRLFKDGLRDRNQSLVYIATEFPQDTILPLLTSQQVVVRLRAESSVYFLFPDLCPPQWDDAAERPIVGNTESIEVGNIKTPTYASSAESSMMAKWIPHIVPQFENALNEAAKPSFALPMRYTSLIRVSSWYMQQMRKYDESIGNLMWQMFEKIAFTNQTDDCNVLELLKGFTEIPGTARTSFASEHLKRVIELIFPIDFGGNQAIAVDFFFSFINFAYPVYSKNPQMFIKVLQNSEFRKSLCSALSSNPPNPDVILTLVNTLSLNNPEVAKEFREAASAADVDPESDLGLSILAMTGNVRKLTAANVDTILHGLIDKCRQKLPCSDTCQLLLQTDVEAPSWLCDEVGIVLSMIHKEEDISDVIAHFCTKSKPLRTAVVNSLMTRIRKQPKESVVWASIGLLSRVIDDYNPGFYEIIRDNLNDSTKHVKETLQAVSVMRRFINRVPDLNGFLPEICRRMVNNFINDGEFVSLLGIILKKLTNIQRGIALALLSRQLSESCTTAVVEKAALIISEVPEIHNEIIDALEINPDMFDYWEEDSFQYMELFLKNE